MITRFGMAPRLKGASVEEFQEHWKTSHADAAGQIPNLRRYTQNHGVIVDGDYLLGYPGFDACSELDFDSVEDMEQGFASETYQTLVRADEDDFVDKTRFSMMVGRQVGASPGHGQIKLITMLRAHPAAGGGGLIDTLAGPYREVLEGFTEGHVIYEVALAAHESIPAAFDAAEVIWFENRSQLGGFLASKAWRRATWELSGKASGIARMVATPVDVV